MMARTDLKSPHVVLASLWLMFAVSAFANGGFLQMRNGYFWDPLKAEYFIPRGMAYQTFNPPVGADQSFEQLEYDLREFKKIYANSVRCEMVWNEVERSQGAFDWSRPDFLVAKADELGLKLFVLIGFQYAPSWFPNDWKAVNDVGSNSVVLAYEHPQARAAYSNFIYQVTSRYRNSTAIGAWILGNEYAYFDLWEPARHHLGYDTNSLARFREYLANTYSNNIAALRINWQTNYSSFSVIDMPRTYPPNRHYPAYHDLLQWRKASIGSYVTVGALAAKAGDPNHLRTYSMVGGLFGEADIHYTCEDAKTIVASCAAAGAPLHFWSINNYAQASLVNELRSADFGIAKHQAASGLPVMVSETGHTSTENLYEGAAARQPAALPSQIWESLMSGAIGTHIFTWNDRDMFSGDNFPREKGFGIVQQNRLIKDPVYRNVVEMFRRMEQLNIAGLFGGSTNPPADMLFFWSKHTDMGWPRANHENIRLWSTLKRLGYQPGIIDDDQFERGEYTAARALVLSRCYQMDPRHLDRIATNVIAAGIHVHASADFPGQYNAYHRLNSSWAVRMSSLFGLNVTAASAPWDAGAVDPEHLFRVLEFDGVNSLGTFGPGYFDAIDTWKIWQGLTATAGTTIVTHRGMTGTGNIPALHVRTVGTARTAINTFALGDIGLLQGQPPTYLWDFRYKWLQAIYRNHFGMTPSIELTGNLAQIVFPDYRVFRNGSVLVSLLNGHTNSASVTVNAAALLSGKTVENLTSGGIVETNSDGVVSLTLAGDQYVLLYGYSASGSTATSLVNSNRNKLWFENTPNAVWPDGNNATVNMGFDTVAPGLELVVAFERRMLPAKVYGQSVRLPVSASGTVSVPVPVPDADLNDIDYLSTLQGGSYQWHAWLEQGGIRLTEIALPVQLLWGVRPDSLPTIVTAGNNYQVILRWEDLPSYEPSEDPSPLSRADRWEPLKANLQFYNVILELRNATGTIATDTFLTSTGTDSHAFSIRVPGIASGPFNWFASLRPVHGVSHDVFDSFEDRATGATTNSPFPWRSYVYSEFNTAQWFAEGVYTNRASEGRQGAFLIVSNPPTSGSYAGFGFYYPVPASWALPNNVSDWTNYTFACDFREESALPCVLELQLKDVRGGTLTLTRSYAPAANGWATLSGSLNQFVVSASSGFFDPSAVSSLFLNVQMLQKSKTYFMTFDNVRFDGPDRIPTVLSAVDVHDTFEDRTGGSDPLYIKPWDAYSYSELPTSNMVIAIGVGTEATFGGQSAFMIVTNPASVGAFSGFLFIRPFSQVWSLPASQAEWTNYVFSWDFKEASGRACILELQIKDTSNSLLHYTNAYNPGPNGWQTISARLNQFRKPSWVTNEFNPASIKELLVIVQMLETDATYFGFFDNIHFSGPTTMPPLEPVRALYRSDNDSARDTDLDGLSDAYEISIGTNPARWDTDGDGVSDRDEVIAGTNPNSALDVLRIQSISNQSGQPVLSWMARSNRVYDLHFFDGSLRSDAQFCPVEGLGSIRSTTNGLLQVSDPSGIGAPLRTYRLSVHQP